MTGIWEMTMRNIALTLLVLVLAVTAGAQDLNLPPGKWWDNERLAERLELTDAQREQIRTQVYEHAHRMIDLNAGVKKAELELVNLVANADFEAAAARVAFAGLQDARRALESERFEMLLAVRGVLTDEQWQEIQEIRRQFRRSHEQDGPPGQRPRRRDVPPDSPGI